VTRIDDSKRRRKRKAFSFLACRLREIERTIPTRDLDQIRAVLPEVAATYRQIIARRWSRVAEGELQDRMQQWCIRMRISRIFTDDEIAEAIDQAEQRNHLATNDKLAAILGLEYADRQRLAIGTIGAIDKSKRERTIARKERKREKDRIRKAIRRRNANKPSRSEWLSGNHLLRTRPWEQHGISQRTWYRRRGTGWSPPLESLPSEQPLPSGRDHPLTPAQLDAVIDLAVEIGVIEQPRSVGGRKFRAA
jgi:hypothetical protein